MKVRFLGGVNEVGRNAMLLEADGGRALFDYGMAPTDPPRYPAPCPKIEAAFLTHAHLDHSGMMAAIAGHHQVPIVGTPPSHRMAEILAHDSLKIARLEGYPDPYHKTDIAAMRAWAEDAYYGETHSAAGLDVRLHTAGHIPGSTMYEVDDGSRTLVFTGDINLIDTRLVKRAKPVDCDVLVVEATYSGRTHPDRSTTEEAFLDAVEETLDKGGRVVVPSFAIGRTQEVLMLLAGHGYDVWVDGMGKTMAQIMLDEGKFLRSAKDLSRAVEESNFVRSRNQRERALRGDVIVTTSGMMEGGPVMHYMEHLRDDPRNSLFFTGYQAEGTGGRQVLEHGTLDIQGVPEKIHCEIRHFDFSAHAGHDEIVEFARGCGAEDIVLFHTDKPEALADELGGFAKVHLLEQGKAAQFTD